MSSELSIIVGVAVIAGIAVLLCMVRHLGKEVSGLTARIDQGIGAALNEKATEIGNVVAMIPLGFKFPTFFGGASIDGFHAKYLVQHLVATPPKSIVELGSGSSTVLIAHTMKALGLEEYDHVAIDHDNYFLELTKRYAALNGVADSIRFFCCPIEELGPSGEKWYAHVPETLGGRKIDLLIVDGPPAYERGQEQARAPALDILFPHLAERCTIILDDANRPGESQIVKQWCQKYPQLRVTRLPQGKGLAIFTRETRETT